MLNQVGFSHLFSILSTRNHIIPSATYDSISSNETSPLTTTRQQKKVSTRVIPSQKFRYCHLAPWEVWLPDG